MRQNALNQLFGFFLPIHSVSVPVSAVPSNVRRASAVVSDFSPSPQSFTLMTNQHVGERRRTIMLSIIPPPRRTNDRQP